jgi:hypothetical protein
MESTIKRLAKKLINTGSDSPRAYREAINANADILEGLGLPGLIVSHNASYDAVNGELGMQEKSGATITLPAAAANAIVGIFCGPGATSAKVAAAGAAKILGDFIEPSASIALATRQHVFLQADGTNWFIIAGEPKRSGYEAPVARVTNTEYEPSATRETFVIVRGDLSSGVAEAACEGQDVGEWEGTAGSLAFFCPAGAKWKITGTFIGGSLSSIYLPR